MKYIQMLKKNAVEHMILTFYLIKQERGAFHRIVYPKYPIPQ